MLWRGAIVERSSVVLVGRQGAWPGALLAPQSPCGVAAAQSSWVEGSGEASLLRQRMRVYNYKKGFVASYFAPSARGVWLGMWSVNG